MLWLGAHALFEAVLARCFPDAFPPFVSFRFVSRSPCFVSLLGFLVSFPGPCASWLIALSLVWLASFIALSLLLTVTSTYALNDSVTKFKLGDKTVKGKFLGYSVAHRH